MFYSGLLSLLGYGFWQLGFLAMVIGTFAVVMLTVHRLWLPVLLGGLLGLR